MKKYIYISKRILKICAVLLLLSLLAYYANKQYVKQSNFNSSIKDPKQVDIQITNLKDSQITNKQHNTQKNSKDIFSITSVTKLTLAESKRYYATLKEDESKIYSLSVRTDGFVEDLFIAQTYAQVKANTPLFSFYAPEIIDAQSEFLETIHHSSVAQQKLLLLGIHPKEIIKLKQNRKIINDVFIYAPFDGIVFNKNINKGSSIKKGDEVFKIIDISKLWVIANINQEDLEFMKHNHIAYAQIDGHKGKIPITFDTIYPNVINNFIQARFILSNPKLEFFPNTFAQVTIESIPKKRLVLPKNAVLFKNNKYFVFIPDEEEFIPQEIQAKRILGTKFYEILDGLEEGDKVIKDALFMVDSDAQNNGWFE